MSGDDWRRGLLVSVRDATEAAAAAAAGADIVDVKEPAHGPLGRATVAVAAEVVAAVGGRAPVTLACGELASGSDAILAHLDRLHRLQPRGPRPVAVKAGPAGVGIEGWRESFLRLAAGLPPSIGAVAVAYADWSRAAAPHPAMILDAAVRSGAVAVLIDTFDKQGPGLFEAVDATTLRSWVGQAARVGLPVALAGRLAAADVEAAFRLGARICGVRSAACEGGRAGRVCGTRVRGLVTLASQRRHVSAVDPRETVEP